MKRTVILAAALLLGAGCIPLQDPAAIPPATITPPAPGANPLAGARFHVEVDSRAKQQADAWRASRPADAAVIDKLAQKPVASWFGDWNPDVSAAVDAYVARAERAGALPLLV